MEYERGFAIEVPDARTPGVPEAEEVVEGRKYDRINFGNYSIVFDKTCNTHAGLLDNKWFVCVWNVHSKRVHVLQGPFDTLAGALAALQFELDEPWVDSVTEGE